MVTKAPTAPTPHGTLPSTPYSKSTASGTTNSEISTASLIQIQAAHHIFFAGSAPDV
jgi:hypothetical protein